MKAMTDDGRELEIITRAEAKAKGLKRYFTGKPCKHGHVAERRADDFHCVVCKKKKEAAYREKPSTKLKEAIYKKEYYKNNKSIIDARNRKYVEANRDKSRGYTAKWVANNQDKIAEYVEKNKDKIATQKKIYNVANNGQIKEKKRSIMREIEF